ncbi:MAG: MBL fold metallo-hydrolase [Nitrospinales bacterium]
MKIRFWGVRGSVPSGSRSTAGVGGNTTCLELRCGNDLVIFDSGTGIRNLGVQLMKELPVKAKIFYSHVHWDHIQGLPFFTPLYIKGNEFDIYGGSSMPLSIEDVLKNQMTVPCFPVGMDIMAATTRFHDLKLGDVVEGNGYRVSLAMLNHPNRCHAYRIDEADKSIVLATDTEHFDDRLDENLMALADGADVLIYDCQFTPSEYYGKDGQMSRVGWGHSTMQEGVKIAKAANVKHLILFHHDPSHDDKFMQKIEAETRQLFPNSTVAYEGMEIDLEKEPITRSLFD